ncbi:MAG: DUF2177 family protein [Saprospiraceae bacterium]|jgi:uncharacterized membrane protein|nr:DUF2177 family protein [Saprospiraceae bacterium]
MQPLKWLALYVLVMLVFFAIDLIWLGFAGRHFYQKHLGHLLGEVNWTAALIFYLLYIVGILIFAVVPALEKEAFSHALIYGALFGFFCYATYDLTNLATLKSWPTAIVFIDIPWGTFLTAAVAGAGYHIGKWLF